MMIKYLIWKDDIWSKDYGIERCARKYYTHFASFLSKAMFLFKRIGQIVNKKYFICRKELIVFSVERCNVKDYLHTDDYLLTYGRTDLKSDFQ